ncbi:hypothetical protein [Roseibium sp. SCP14]|uniref:hypothetical protein n=1 Tax=Roseibium sp. SCP14 TaxID=3141375 RepID=UPI003335404F
MWDFENQVFTEKVLTADEARKNTPSLSRRQFRRGLLKAGEILPGKQKVTSTEIEALIASIPDETEREEAEIDWQDAEQFERLTPLVVTLSSALGFTPEEVDTLWQVALQI